MAMRVDIIPEQKFKLGTAIYIAVPAKNSCWGCAFKGNDATCFKSPFCGENQRQDRTNVIFVREKVK